MFGAALATGCAPLISMAILSSHKWRGRCQFGLTSIPLRPSPFLRIISTGFSALIGEISSGIIMLFFNFTILTISGNIGVAAYGIIANLALIVVSIFTGLGQGIQPLISRYTGSGDRSAVGKILKMALIVAIVGGIGCFSIGALLADPIVAAFNRDADPLLASIAIEGMRLYSLAFLMMGINLVLSATFAAMAKPLPAFLISITRGLLAVVPLILLLPSLFGMTGVWMVIPFAELFTLLLSGILCLRDRRLASPKNSA